MNILLVDDEPKFLHQLAQDVQALLPDARLNVFTMAQEALNYAAAHMVDVAFLGVQLHQIDGLLVARRLAEMYPRVNIIFCAEHSGYAIDAHQLYCSGYLLKPISREQLRAALAHLRYPALEARKRITIQCFGNFEVFCDGEPVRFKYKRTKELLAYLVDRNGADCTPAWISAALFGDEEHASYLRQLRKDLLDTFETLGAPDVIRSTRSALGINRSAVSCDYFDFRDGKRTQLPDDYMSQYSFTD